MKTKKGIQMDISEENGKMEGWLFLIRSNRFGLQYSRKRYYVLEEHSLNCFKSTPISEKEIPIRSALIDSCIRVTDNGRENIQRKVFFIFTLYNASNHNDQLKLGAGSSEEAAKWIHSIMESALKECPNQGENILARSRSKWQSHRQMGCHTNLQMRRGEYCRICKLLSRHKGMSRMNTLDFLDWTVFSSLHTEPMSADVVAPSPWIIFGCKNGLRLFRESKDGDFHGKHWDDHPAIMAVGVVDATSESVFQTVMSLGPSRAEWDFCFSRGSVVDHLDGHTDIIHKQMNSNWLPWGMKRRDLLLRRYWRREDDGTYGGGYVISTLNQGKQCVVKHMLAIDWKFWKSYVITSSASCITIRMLGRIAALREMFRAKLGNYSCSDFSSGELAREMLPHSEKEDIMEDVQIPKENNQSKDSAKEAQELNVKPSNHGGSFLQLNDAADEFFDVPEQSEYSEHFDLESSQFGLHHLESPNVMDPQVLDLRHAKLSTAAVFVKKKLHDLAVQSKGCIDFSEVAKDDDISWNYGSTLPKDPNCNLACSWAMSDPSTYLIRGAHYLDDHQKIKPKGTMMQMVAADWLRSDKREDDLSGRPGSFVQKHAAHGGKEFFFTVNIQVPGATTYNLVSYYMLDSPVENIPVLERFIKGDNAYRNSRFKLIPYISKGSWLVKQSVGKKACLVGQALEINYFHGKNYLELGIDVGSSTVARGVVSLVLGYLTNLVIEMAFLIQANTEDELPEVLLGTCRFNHLDVSKSVSVKP